MSELFRVETTIHQSFDQFPHIEESIKRFLQEIVLQLYQLALITGGDKKLTLAQEVLKKSPDPYDRCLQEEHQLRLLRDWLSNIISPPTLPLFTAILIKLMEALANTSPTLAMKNTLLGVNNNTLNNGANPQKKLGRQSFLRRLTERASVTRDPKK